MTDPDDIPPDAQAQADDTFADIDTNVLLAQILAELQTIRRTLTEADTESDDAVAYRCRRCGETVPEDDRKRHAEAQHRAPPGTEDSLFEVVER
jgi:hypothetical protein